MRTLLLTTFFCAIVASAAHAQRVYTPAAGSPERTEIMDVLRVPAERDLKQSVIFRVQHLKISGDWAFARVVPLQPNGRDIDYRRTKYREQDEEGMFDGEAEALLRKRGGEWQLLEYRFGATDTEVDIWQEKYGFPQAIAR
jgi:hypothetical protein